MQNMPADVASWRDQIERLSENASPCRYPAPARWAVIRASAITFCDEHGTEAHRFGWTAPELFAVHADHGTLRIDYCGALMVSGSRARAVEPTRVLFERGSAYRTKPGQVWGVPVWQFTARAG